MIPSPLWDNGEGLHDFIKAQMTSILDCIAYVHLQCGWTFTVYQSDIGDLVADVVAVPAEPVAAEPTDAPVVS